MPDILLACVTHERCRIRLTDARDNSVDAFEARMNPTELRVGRVRVKRECEVRACPPAGRLAERSQWTTRRHSGCDDCSREEERGYKADAADVHTLPVFRKPRGKTCSLTKQTRAPSRLTTSVRSGASPSEALSWATRLSAAATPIRDARPREMYRYKPIYGGASKVLTGGGVGTDQHAGRRPDESSPPSVCDWSYAGSGRRGLDVGSHQGGPVPVVPPGAPGSRDA